MQKYQNSNKIRLERNPKNLGRVKNHRHLLYELARGDYTLMLDGDDYLIDNNFVVDAVKMVVENNLRLVFAETKAQNVKTGQVRSVSFPFNKTGLVPYQEIFKRGILFMHGAVLYKRDLALKLDFHSKDIIADDNESFLRSIVGEKVGFIKRPVYVYQWDNSPDRHTLKQRLDNIEMIDLVYQHVISVCPGEQKLFDWWREQMFSTIFYGHLINLGYHKKYNQVRQYLTRYVQRYGLKHFLQSLRYPLTAYRWGGY